MSTMIIKGRRFWGLALPILLVLALFLVFGQDAGAVHAAGKFQLDGDAQVSLNSTPPAAEDWDVICAAEPATCTFAPGYTPPGAPSTANATLHVADVLLSTGEEAQNATIFTGGGSKDPQNIDQWLYKDDTGGLPDKDNLQHGFAARYSRTADAATCPSSTATCDLIYFGMDRFDNSGDAVLGFWFFKNEIGLTSTKSGGGFKFSGVHSVGDLLVVADFSNGGQVATINVYKWDPANADTSGTLDFLGGSEDALCTEAALPAADPFCGVVNPVDETISPWTFTDKTAVDGHQPNRFLNGELFEGGINLSDPSINLGGTCFSSFLVESRSSTSPTATLKDFILGGFGACETTLTTAQTWRPNDSATVGVTGAGLWSGTVTFTLYEHGSGAECTGTVRYGPEVINVNQGTTFPVTTNNTTYSATSSGNFSWKVEFSSPTPGVPAKTECETTSLTITN